MMMSFLDNQIRSVILEIENLQLLSEKSLREFDAAFEVWGLHDH